MFAEWAKVAKPWSDLQTFRSYRRLKTVPQGQRPTLQELRDGRPGAKVCRNCGRRHIPVVSIRTINGRAVFEHQCDQCGYPGYSTAPQENTDVRVTEDDGAKAKAMEDELKSLCEFVESEAPELLPLVPVLDTRSDPRPDVEKAQLARELHAKLLQRMREPQALKPRLVFEDETQTVYLDGVEHRCGNSRSYFLYQAIAKRIGQEVTSGSLRSEIKGLQGDKTIRNLIKALPPALRSTVKSGPRGYWLNLPPNPADKKIRN